MSTSREREHLGHLDARRGEQDVDAGRVAPQDVARSDSAIRSVGRSRIDGASTGTLSSERRSPNWRLPSIRTVRWLELAEGDREVERDGRLADAALRREDAHDPRCSVDAWCASKSLRTRGDPGHQVEAGERHRQDAVDARARVRLDRVLGHGQHDDRHAELGLVDLLDELGALEPALQQGVDEDDVGPQLADRGDAPWCRRSRTSSSLTAACAFSRPRMYCATCGTSSTMSRRV